MILPLKNWFCGLILSIAMFSIPQVVIAQGPPSTIDSCVVTQPIHFKCLPVPGKFQPGSIEQLRNCPALADCLVKIANAKAGKAVQLRIELWMQHGKLQSMVAITHGEKGFAKLYRELRKEAGRPTKLVDSKGVRAYHWERGSDLPCHVVLLYEPSTGFTKAILDKPKV